jgi:hypothetical protein
MGEINARVASKINDSVRRDDAGSNLDVFADCIRANSSRMCMAIQDANMAARIDGYVCRR